METKHTPAFQKAAAVRQELREMFAGLVMVPTVGATTSLGLIAPSQPPANTPTWVALEDQTRALLRELEGLQLEFKELLDAVHQATEMPPESASSDAAIRASDYIAQTAQRVAAEASSLAGAIKWRSMAARDKAIKL